MRDKVLVGGAVVALALWSVWLHLQPPERAPNGVELALRCQTSAGTTQLRITLRNTGSTFTQIVLGTNVSNGYRYEANYLVLDVKRDGNSAVEEFHPSEGPIMGGRADPWVVRLPGMSEFSFLQAISRFTSLRTFDSLKIGGSAIDVRLHYVTPDHWHTAELNRMVVFDGELTTEWLRVPDHCHAA